MSAKSNTPIIRRVQVVEGGGHHGGGWKVAYADFMTAMMAFFLLMWILSSSDEQKLRGIAEYFTNATMPGGSGVLDGATLGPPGTLSASNGATVARGSELGKVDDPSPATWEIMDTTPTANPQQQVKGTTDGQHDNPATGAATERAEDALNPAAASAANSEIQTEADEAHARDVAQLEALESELVMAMQNNPDLRPLQKNVVFEKTPLGLRIQIIDQEGRPMFASGQAVMNETTRELIATLGHSISKLDNKVVISGHTDSVPFTNTNNYDNWDLSSDRANATRRLFVGSGVSQDRIVRVSGLADSEPYVPDNPRHESNRRVSILLEYDAPKIAPNANAQANAQVDAPAQEEPVQVAQVAVKAPSRLESVVLDNLRDALR